MRSFLTDVRHAARSLGTRRAYLITCAGTLALVLGANAATLAVVNATLLRPLPFTAGDGVVHLFALPPGMTDPAQRNPLQQMDFVRVRERATTMQRVEGFLPGERVLAGSDGPVVVPGARVTAGLLAMMGVAPLVGRTFQPEDETPGHDVVVVTYGYWQGALGGADVLGSAIAIDGVPHTVVGITAPGFPPPFLDGSLFTPLVASPEPTSRNPSRSVVTLGELAPGRTPLQADAEAAAIVRQLAGEFPTTHNGWTGGAETARQWQFGRARSPSLVLFGATALVLLIAAANIANLTAAQATGRATEIAVRTALGASPWDLARLQIAELAVVAIAGVVPGLLIARAAVPALLALDPAATTALGPVWVDWRVQGLTLLLAIVAAAGAALLPALRAARGNTAATLADGSRRGTGARAGHRTRRGLVALQVALCLALLMSSAVVLDGLRRATRIDPGFNPAGVLTAQLRLPPGPYDTTERRAALVDQVLARLRALPGVASASTTMNDFMADRSYQTAFIVEGRPTPDGQPHTVQFRRVSPGYFRTMEIRERRGRTFTEQDAPSAPAVAVVSQQLADQLFPGEEAVGRVLRRSNLTLTIVGVVDDVRDLSLTQAAQPTLYQPWAQSNSNAVPVTFVLRSTGAPERLIGAARAAVLAVDPGLPLRRVQTLEAFLADSIAPERFRTTVLGIVAGLGLVLAALGIYGVVHRTVIERSREFAVRMALGAGAPRVIRQVMADAVRDVAAGATAGVLVGLWACSVLARVMGGVGDSTTLATLAAVSVLAAVAFAATLVPALRVVRVQPGDALKAQ